MSKAVRQLHAKRYAFAIAVASSILHFLSDRSNPGPSRMSSESSALFNGSSWSRDQDKAFENALAIYYGEMETGDGWEKIAAEVPGKTVEEIKLHYQILVEDVDAIESGAVPLPCFVSASLEKDSASEGAQLGQTQSDSFQGGMSRRGIAWSEDEHRLFLRGLEKYGKGDWKSISRHFVVSRSPAQVASHAQKYFLRLTTSANKKKRRSSIYDITDVGGGDASTQQEPISGQKTVDVLLARGSLDEK